jgi:hypothetical protein
VAGFIEVNIHTDRPSFFAAVLGIARQNVDAGAIAGNSDQVSPPYSMLALNDDCTPNPSVQVNGNGAINVAGPVVVNSTCDGALQVGGNGALTAPECTVAGTTQVSGKGASLTCDVQPFDGTGDPLGGTGPGAQPTPPAALEILEWKSKGIAEIPPGCPGSTVSITYVDRVVVLGAAVPLPAAWAAGDVAIAFAYRTGSNTPPDLATGWTDVRSDNGADLNSRRIASRVLDGSETGFGTWTNATAVAVVVLRGADADAGKTIGAIASSGGPAGSTMTTPALAGMASGFHSWVIAFAGAAGGASGATLPAGPTARSDVAVPPLAIHTQGNIVSWASQNYGGTYAGANRTDAVEILANPNPSTAGNPAGCQLNGAGGAKGTNPYNVYRIHPGIYYGGLHLSGRAKVLMAPGTYWIAGGGININGQDAQLISVDGATSTTATTSASPNGVFIYFTEDALYHSECAAIPPTAPAGACVGGFRVNGGSSGTCASPPQPPPNPATQPCQYIHLDPNDAPIENLLMFVDRTLTADIVTNGNAGQLELSGTIYNPKGDVQINGGAEDTVSAQIISYTIHITGNGGFAVTYDSGGVVKLDGVGLVK